MTPTTRKRRPPDGTIGAMSKAGLSSPRLRRMRDVLHGYVERGELTGFVTLVSRRGDVHVDCDGYERDTIFRIASMTKPVTAAAAMSLVEEGVIGLDDPVGNLLPELAQPRVLRAIDAVLDDTVAPNRPITVRDLLTLTLGTGLVFAEPGAYPIQEALERNGFGVGLGPKPAADEFMSRLSKIPLVHQPGEVWMYNIGSDVLGILVERAAGRSLGEVMRERIFEPLGMKDTGFSVPADRISRVPVAYVPRSRGGLKVEDGAGADSTFSRPPALESGAGGLAATVDDFLLFAQMLLDYGAGGSRRILARPTVEAMTADQLPAEVKARSPWTPGWFETHSWGFGVGVVTRRFDGTKTAGAYGWSGGYGTDWWNDPAEDMVAILMTQVGMTSPDGPGFYRDFRTLAYSALE
jgi:CubicO group peptidase (beta-lactamase class C family)